MVNITRFTTFSDAPINIFIATDQGEWDIVVDGPHFHRQIPGSYIFALQIEGCERYGINLSCGDIECGYDQLPSCENIGIIDAITIFDGFTISNACGVTGCTVRPEYTAHDKIFESGFSYLN